MFQFLDGLCKTLGCARFSTLSTALKTEKRGEIVEDIPSGRVYATRVVDFSLSMGASFRCLRGRGCGSAKRTLVS